MVQKPLAGTVEPCYKHHFGNGTMEMPHHASYIETYAPLEGVFNFCFEASWDWLLHLSKHSIKIILDSLGACRQRGPSGS